MKALFIHDGFFPNGTAFASRLYNMAELFYCCGVDVHIIAAYSKDNSIAINNTNKIGNVSYQITDIMNRGSIDTFFGPHNFIRTVIKYIRTVKIDLVLTSRGITYYSKLVKECKSNRVKCYVEQCEWLDVSSFKFGKIDPRYLRMDYLFRKGYQSADGIIAISRLLESHFKLQGIKTIRIPTIIDVVSQPYTIETQNDKIVVVFTGSLGSHKELLSPIITVLKNNKYIQEKVEFHIYGPSKRQVVFSLEEPDDLNLINNVYYHGFVDHSEVQEALRKADFQYFIRPDRRSSNAGFPTKLGESLSVGTPCITNDTGDITVYLENGKNSYIVGKDIIGSLTEIFENIISQTCETRKSMRIAARKTAEKFFDLRNYQRELTEFLEL